jgi:hypothetical protein
VAAGKLDGPLLWVGFRAAYLIAYHANRMRRTVMRVTVQVSISATQMSANSKL